MKKKYLARTIAAGMISFTLILSGCGNQDANDAYSDETEYDEESYEDGEEVYDEEEVYVEETESDDDDYYSREIVGERLPADRFHPENYSFTSTLTEEGQIVSYDSDGRIAFCTGDFYGEPVYNVDDALAAIDSIKDSIGIKSDSETELALNFETTINGITFYSFRQTYDDYDVANTVVKIATDENGKVLGLISAVKPEVEDVDDLTEHEDHPTSSSFFDGLTPTTWSGTVEYGDLGKKEVTIPVVEDPSNGKLYLADKDRQIIFADYATFNNDTGDFEPLVLGEGEYADNEIAYFDLLVKICDYYAERGWRSPDGEGTPVMALIERGGDAAEGMDASVAAYVGFDGEYQRFMLSSRLSNEIDLELVGHEFTHCVTDANKMGPYRNEAGAINESLSDIQGNNMEEAISGKPTTWWENCFESTKKDDYAYYVWGENYTPNIAVPNQSENDLGDVHHRSFVPSSISYRLAKAGMTPEEQFYFWMFADLALAQNIDFKLFTERLPWCMEIAGYPQYEETLLAAIDASGMTDRTIPDEAPKDLAMVRFTYPDKDFAENHEIYINICEASEREAKTTWPEQETCEVASVVEPADYVLYAKIKNEDGEESKYYYDGSKWVQTDHLDDIPGLAASNPDCVVTLNAGDVVWINTEGLPES